MYIEKTLNLISAIHSQTSGPNSSLFEKGTGLLVGKITALVVVPFAEIADLFSHLKCTIHYGYGWAASRVRTDPNAPTFLQCTKSAGKVVLCVINIVLAPALGLISNNLNIGYHYHLGLLVQLVQPAEATQDPPSEKEITDDLFSQHEQVSTFYKMFQEKPQHFTNLLFFTGTFECGQKEIAGRLATALGYSFSSLHITEYDTSIRDIINSDSVVFIEVNNKTNRKHLMDTIETASRKRDVFIIIAAEPSCSLSQSILKKGAFSVNFELPDTKGRELIIKELITSQTAAFYSEAAAASAGETRDTLVAIAKATVSQACLNKKAIDSELFRTVLTQYREAALQAMNVTLGEKATFDDVVGAGPLKERLYAQVINPVAWALDPNPNPDEEPMAFPAGLLFTGPPGCGKTHIAQAIAGELSKVLKGRHIPTFLAKASDLGTSFVNETASNISKLFREISSQAPCILFLDEFDALAPNRSYVGREDSKTVNALLVELANAPKRQILVIAATNLKHDLDPAITRAGRINTKIEIPPPDKTSRVALFKHGLRVTTGKPIVAGDMDYDRLADRSNGWSCADILTCAEKAKYWRREQRPPASSSGQDRILLTTERMETLMQQYQQTDRAGSAAFLAY